jgi:hypothetical protein
MRVVVAKPDLLAEQLAKFRALAERLWAKI